MNEGTKSKTDGQCHVKGVVVDRMRHMRISWWSGGMRCNVLVTMRLHDNNARSSFILYYIFVDLISPQSVLSKSFIIITEHLVTRSPVVTSYLLTYRVAFLPPKTFSDALTIGRA